MPIDADIAAFAGALLLAFAIVRGWAAVRAFL